MSDLKHDFVRTFVSPMDAIDWPALTRQVDAMKAEGGDLLTSEGIKPKAQEFTIKFDCRYLKQYHEVSFEVSDADFTAANAAAITAAFHAEHNRLYGYSLDDIDAAVEIINVRVQAL